MTDTQSPTRDRIDYGSQEDDLSPTLHVNQPTPDRAFLVVSAPDGADASEAAAKGYAMIAEEIRRAGLEIVQERIFGSLNVEGTVKAARLEALRSRSLRSDGPVTYVQGRPSCGDGLAGVIIHAVPTARTEQGVTLVHDDQVPCGRTWRTGDTTFMILQNLRGTDDGPGKDNTPATQSRRMIERAERILREHGLAYRNTVRTWFYLSNILSWYNEFNRVRNAKYSEYGLMPQSGDRHLLPASTGIRADLSAGAACELDVLAVATEGAAKPIVARVSNPHQQEAFHYGSAFSRSAVVRGAKETLIEISGTAAIDECGKSLFPGEIRAQVHCTLDKIDALLGQSGASLQDICAATVFFKDNDDLSTIRHVLADRGLEQFPAVYVVADVCRQELLFEIDAEAVVRHG